MNKVEGVRNLFRTDPNHRVFVTQPEAISFASFLNYLTAYDIQEGKQPNEFNPKSPLDRIVRDMNLAAKKPFSHITMNFATYDYFSNVCLKHVANRPGHPKNKELLDQDFALFLAFSKRTAGRTSGEKMVIRMYKRFRHRIKEIDWEEVLDAID